MASLVAEASPCMSCWAKQVSILAVPCPVRLLAAAVLLYLAQLGRFTGVACWLPLLYCIRAMCKGLQVTAC